MPIEPTPFEHVVVAEATYVTPPVMVAPFAGSLTDTPANAAGIQTADRHTNSDNDLSIKNPFSDYGFISFRVAELDLWRTGGCARERTRGLGKKWRLGGA